MAKHRKDSFVSHPTEGRAYTRPPDAIVPSEIWPSDILPMEGGQEIRNPASEVAQQKEPPSHDNHIRK